MNNRYFTGGGYDEQRANGYENCKKLCLSERRCNAFEFLKNKRRCQLFESEKESFDTPASDVGLKRQN